jgi:hypothetical protein
VEQLSREALQSFAEDNIRAFHKARIEILRNMQLKDVLRKKNPYLFRAKNLLIGADLVKDILDAYLYASEEGKFGAFLEDLAIHVSGQVSGGKKSSAEGIDLEFDRDGVRFLVSVKSGPNWGNSSQQKKQAENLQKAAAVVKQSRSTISVETVLGICYGRTRTSVHKRYGYTKYVGQCFWYLLSGSETLYTDIVVPIGHRAKKHNDDFLAEKARVINEFTQDFMRDFCTNGVIDWQKLVEYNSGNLHRSRNT